MSHEVKAITIRKPNNKLPVILNNKFILKEQLLPLKGNVIKVIKSFQYQEDVLYETRPGDFLCGDVREAVIVNRLNKQTNSCRTIAKCKSHSGQEYEKTSDEVTKVIGQSNYDKVFTALCSVINQELRIRGIYSLLTVPKATKPMTCQVEAPKKNSDCPTIKTNTEFAEVHCQTEESFIASYKLNQMRRRVKRSQPAPYVVREIPVQKKPRRLIIPPSNFKSILKESNEIPPSNFRSILKESNDIKQEESQKVETVLPEITGNVFSDEDSNHSVGKLSSLSVATTVLDTSMENIMVNVDKNTQSQYTHTLHDFDSGKLLHINDKPASLNDGPKSMSHKQRIQLLLQQGLFDYQNCLQRDESGHLPIHVAVLTNDMGLLKRQCVVLKMRNISVDIKAETMTPLKMALYQDNLQLTSLLLQYNADVLESDAQDRTYFHITAEMRTEHLKVLVNHCRHNARKILEEYESLWKPDYEKKSDSELADILLTHINKISNDQGYTPLMLASKLGLYENVKLLVESAPTTVNVKMPNSGNTALYIAVGAACMDCNDRGNKSKVVDHFRKTIEALVENGADPNSKNFDGANVNDLLTEYNIADLSMLIANKLTYRNLGESKIPPGKQFDAYMLVKDEAGNVDIKTLTLEKSQKNTKSGRVTKATKKSPLLNSPKKPIIIKSETITDNSPIRPTISSIGKNISANIGKKVGLVNNISKVQSFRMNKPLILRSVSSKKRQLEITYEPNDKSITND